MLSGFINFKKVRPQSSRIDAIREMLRSTWDLSAQFKAKSGALDYEAVKTFNLFFSRLNQIMTQVLKNVVALASLAPSMFIFSREFRDRTGEQKDRISGISRAGKNMAHQI